MFTNEDGQNIWADLGASNQLLTRSFFLEGDDQLFARISSAGTAAWYLPDRLGSVRDMTDNSGVVYAYNAQGQMTGQTGLSHGQNHGPA